MRRQGHDPIVAAIVRAITAIGGLSTTDREKPMLVVENLVSNDWASATFVGATHDLRLRIVGQRQAVEAASAAITADLSEHEFRIPGHIVAEIAIHQDAPNPLPDCIVYSSLIVNVLTIRD